jgi:hypothetical protein
MVWLSPRVANSHQSDAALFVSCAAFYLRQGALSPVAHDGAALQCTRRPASDYHQEAPKEIGQSVRRANYKLVQQRYPAHFTIRPTDLT